MHSKVALFLTHMFIVGFLAPGFGAGVYGCIVRGSCDVEPVMCFAGTFFVGFFLQFFIWFVTFPFALITMGLCYWLCENEIINRIIWMLGGAIVGGGMGFFFSFWARVPLFPLPIAGAIIGLVSAMLLHAFWTSYYRWEQEMLEE